MPRPAPPDCSLCGGQLRLLHRGAVKAPTAAQFAPSCHTPGAYGDLYRCQRCAAVHQPSLPAGASLRDAYREMVDHDYLKEEAGRRATANRLLDLINAVAPGGERRAARLLDVGCGHGLLLDEARRRGYRAEGIELSVLAAAHARDRLGLPVTETPLEELGSEEDGRWNVVVLADVLEHLEDPAAALERCETLLAPGGTLLLVTPDPSSAVARLAGARWWGYLPAHTVLLPRRALRELVGATGLVIARDVPFVRTFSLGYWMAGLAERSPALAAVTRVARRLPSWARLSLSLGDERVVLASKVEVSAPDRAPVRDASGSLEGGVAL